MTIFLKKKSEIDIVTKLTLLADMMTQWNTCHESQYQLRLVWHHMISQSRLAIKIGKRSQDDQYWWSHDFVIKIDNQD